MMGLICRYSYCKFLNYYSKWETCILKQRVCIQPLIAKFRHIFAMKILA